MLDLFGETKGRRAWEFMQIGNYILSDALCFYHGKIKIIFYSAKSNKKDKNLV